MDESATTLQQLADHKLGGKLQQTVEILRAEGMGWRPLAAEITRVTGLAGIGYESLRTWAERGGWNVDKPTDRAAS